MSDQPDTSDDVVADRGPEAGGEGARAVPGTPPGPAASPVPSPGTVPGAVPGASAPGVQVSQAASPDDGIAAGEKAPGSDAAVTSPGAWTATAVPGKPDGEVDTRAP